VGQRAPFRRPLFLVDVLQEREDALVELCGRLLVVVEEALVGEQVPIAGVQEQLRAVDRLDQLARRGEVFPTPTRPPPSCGSEAGLREARSRRTRRPGRQR
jgi:hypothetical protein